MNERHQPALLGGAFIGVLSALPLIGAGNCCCCLWVVLGGVLVTYLERQQHPGPLDRQMVVRSALLAGIIGAVLCSILDLGFGVVIGPKMRQIAQQVLDALPNVPPELRDLSNAQPPTTVVAGQFLALIFRVLVFGLFSMLGALLGSAIFKDTPQTPPHADV